MSAIQKGDLVMVTKRPRHGCNYLVGHVFVVTKLLPPNREWGGRWTCPGCGASGTSESLKQSHLQLALGHPSGQVVHLSRLIKIDPPKQDESVEHEKGVTA